MPPMSAKQATTVACFADIGGIVNNHCLEVVVCFADIGGIDNNHCLEVVVVLLTLVALLTITV
jgi:NADPH-dependent 7-cyano-7-deazaguanine reductase QueF